MHYRNIRQPVVTDAQAAWAAARGIHLGVPVVDSREERARQIVDEEAFVVGFIPSVTFAEASFEADGTLVICQVPDNGNQAEETAVQIGVLHPDGTYKAHEKNLSSRASGVLPDAAPRRRTAHRPYDAQV